jgi:hypothetical protein
MRFETVGCFVVDFRKAFWLGCDANDLLGPGGYFSKGRIHEACSDFLSESIGALPVR